MPTGYTHQLAERNFDVRNWLLNDLIRGMGVAIMFRDDGVLDIDTMDKKLQDYIATEQVRVDKANAELEATVSKLHLMTDAEWELEHAAKNKANAAEDARRLEEHRVGRAAHQKALDQLLKMQPKAKTEVGIGLLKFAVEQLQTGMGFDYSSEPRDVEVPMSLKEFITMTKEHSTRVAKNTVEYAIKGLVSAKSRAAAFRDVVVEINQLCNELEQP